MYKNIAWILLITVLPLLDYSCKSDEKSKSVSYGTDQKPAKDSATELLLTGAQMQTVGIEVGPVEQKNLEAVVKANGQLAVPPQNKADVSILSGGIISRINVLEGQQVKKGDILASIRNQDLIRLQQDYLAAKNAYAYVQAEFERQQQLKNAGAGTGKSFQASEATYNAETARLRGFESQLNQLGISPAKISTGIMVTEFPVLSPIQGTVGLISSNTGAFVQPGTSIMEVVDNSKIHCDLTVFEKDLMQIKVGQAVSFQLTNQNNMTIDGRITGINKSFENESKGVVVHAVISNADHKNLIPGMYVTALIKTGTQLTCAVPVTAIVRSEGKQYLFVAERRSSTSESFAFEKKEVITGVQELGYVQIKPVDVFKPAVSVVTRGAFYLQSKMATSGKETE